MSLRKEFLPYGFIFLGIFVSLSLLSYDPLESSGQSNLFGKLGYFFSYGLEFLLGKSAYILGIGAFGIGLRMLQDPNWDFRNWLYHIPILVFTFSLLLSNFSNSVPEGMGGWIGYGLKLVCNFAIGENGTAIVTAFLLVYNTIGILGMGRLKEFFSNLQPMILKWNQNYPSLNLSKIVDLWKGIGEYKSQKQEKNYPRAFEENGRTTLNHPKPSSTTIQIVPKYKNTNQYEGYFESPRIYRFHQAPLRLRKKIEETEWNNRFGFPIYDYRKKRVDQNNFDSEENESFNFPIESQNQPSENKSQPQPKVENFLDEMYDINSQEYTSTEEVESQEYENEFEKDYEIQPSSEKIFDPELTPLKKTSQLPKEEKITDASIFQTFVPTVEIKKGPYYISPKLLGSHYSKPTPIDTQAEKDQVARKIEEIISHYGIESKVISMERGPIITRYELTIPNGIKLNRITSLDSELKLYLAVKSIRIVAPIPGKSSIGIEVPNKIREDVYLMDILRETSIQKPPQGLTICIGKDIAGRLVHIDLSKLPHLLVAGTTGSGKSVCLNSMITSYIFTRSPEEVRFIMIDPKMVEMSLYEDIPHLLMPVITDPRKATKALSWAIQEMEARYQTISQLKSRDFSSYNQKVEEGAWKKGFKKMPYIIIMIDELSDLMMVSGKELEEQIQRISQKSRAVGIHLVMATQRPSVDVITGLIKANCPARMAFQVAQKTDSRTILDSNGAETLLGQGDFLYRSPTSSDLVRIQAPYISEQEIDKIVQEVKKLAKPNYVEIQWDEESSESIDVFEEDENLIEDAWRVICQEGKASGSLIQRHLRIGYNKAARIIDILEKRGIVSPQVGQKPREILKTLGSTN